MPRIKLAFSFLDREKSYSGHLMAFLILLSKEKGVKCQLTYPAEAIIEGDKKALLEVVSELDEISIRPIASGISITFEFEESDHESTTEEAEILNNKLVKEANSQLSMRDKNIRQEKLHDMVIERLTKYTKKSI